MAIHEASGRIIPLDSVNPVSLAEPVAPAAATGPVAIDFGRITACFEALAQRHEFVLVEGAGGWLVRSTVTARWPIWPWRSDFP